MSHKLLPTLLIFALLLSACAVPAAPAAGLPVVASTTLVGDVVRVIGGEHIALTVLLPLGSDPHSFEPAPQDLAAVERATLVFLNGFGLEEPLEKALASTSATVIEVSSGIEPLEFGAAPDDDHDDDDHADDGHDDDEDDEHADDGHDEEQHGHGEDPHVWMDPRLVKVWAANIAEALATADPAHADAYRANAAAYQAELDALHDWITAEVAAIPASQRLLIADHDALGYFAAAYGFESLGAVIPSFSSLAEPSASEIAALEDTIRATGAPAIFVDSAANPALAERIAADTGIQIVRLYSGSLSEPGGPAATYLDLMRANVTAIVTALK